jgi:uncharacterized protein
MNTTIADNAKPVTRFMRSLLECSAVLISAATSAHGRDLLYTLPDCLKSTISMLRRKPPSPFHRYGYIAVFIACTTGAVAQPVTDEAVNARLLVSARTGDEAGVARALASGAAVDSRNRIGESPLIIAIKRGYLPMAQRLIDAGADVNQAALNGITPLMAAAYGGHVDLVGRLLAKGADAAPIDRIKKSAMIYAAGEGHTAIVRMLLDKGVDPNLRYDNNLTALMWAAGYGKDDTVKALLSAGARTDLRDNRGMTAADIARDNRFATTAQLLQ